MIELGPGLAIPEQELEWSFARAGGPGGQNVNKVSSKAVLRWRLQENQSLPEHVRTRLRILERKRVTTEGELVLSSQRFRDQERNRQDCLEKLGEIVRQAATLPKPRRATRPTRASRHKRVETKRRRAAIKAGRKVSADD